MCHLTMLQQGCGRARKVKRFLRLDCLASNARLRRYYEDLGFVYRGQLTSGEYVGALYERPATLGS